MADVSAITIKRKSLRLLSYIDKCLSRNALRKNNEIENTESRTE